MAFWKNKSEDPWDMDPNRKREPASFYERDPEPAPALTADAAPEQPRAAEQELQEAAPDCPWCGGKMVRAYLLGGRDMICFADQKPHAFWGSIGHEKTYLGEDTGFLGGNYQSCWQCKPCYKLVVDVPRPTGPFGGENGQDAPGFGWETGPGAGSEGSVVPWDGNPVAPYAPEKQEKEE